MNMKKLFLLNLPYLLFVYPFDKLTQAFRLAPGADLSGKLLSIGDGFTAALFSPLLSFHPTDLLIGIAGAVILRMAVYLKGKNATDIEPLLMAVYELLQESGIFVFATQHPCFVTLTEKYMTPHSYYDIAIEGQPKEQIYYHRSIQDIFNLCFRAGFVIDGFYEECFKTNKEIPMVMIVRLKKVKRDSLK